MKRIEHFVKHRYLDSRIWWHYGTLSPERVALVQSDHHLYADPNDPRARKKIIADSMRQRFPRNQKFWHAAMAEMTPDTVLDIGLNYGECLFSTTLAPNTRAFGFEANPRLRPWVERSLSEHPCREQIEVLFQLVTDGETGTEEFFIDKEWSGGSTAGLDADSFDKQKYEKVVVPKCSIDAALHDKNVTVGSLFFKMDVEGYESLVLRGMQQALASAERFLGFVEFDAGMVQRSGEEVASYWKYLTKRFAVFAFDRADNWRRVDDLKLDQFATFCGKHFHTDLVVTRPHTTDLAETVLNRLDSKRGRATSQQVA